jgi:beta-glucosidase-like glycosyl hydrolase
MIAVGMMSGTSADGVSVAAIRVGRPLKLLAYRTFAYPRALRERVLRARELRTPEISELHGDLGKFFATCAKTFIGRGRPDVIGSHGQTVWHEPGRHTLQLGEAAHIAEATGVPTVCDFRAADIAAGGQGAPLVPYFDRFVFGVREAATLNLGGIANVTVLSKRPLGFDTGPGNCLIDEAMRLAFGRPFDKGGRAAASGRIDRALLARVPAGSLRQGAEAPPRGRARHPDVLHGADGRRVDRAVREDAPSGGDRLRRWPPEPDADGAAGVDAVARRAEARHGLRHPSSREGARGVRAAGGRDAPRPRGKPAVGHGRAARGRAGEDPPVSMQNVVARMTPREKCAQMIYMGCSFPDADPDRTSQLVRKDGVGGMVVLGGSVFDVPSFVNWAQKVSKVPVLVAADFERAGPVSGMTAFPSAAEIAATGSSDFAHTKARLTGLEARALGIRMALGPSAGDPLARSAIDGYHHSKAVVCLRQFPDPGVAGLAAAADALMVGHEVVPELDEEQIASLSRTAIQGIVRRGLRFEGLVVTDALSRLGGGVEILERAANAGADILLRPADPLKAVDALEAAVSRGRVAESTIDRAVTRQLLFKERLGLFADRVTDVATVEQVVGSSVHRAAAGRMAEAVARLRR